MYDGSNANAPWKGTFCGNKKPADIVSKGRSMFVHFNSDNTITKAGFRIQYSVGETNLFNMYVGESVMP